MVSCLPLWATCLRIAVDVCFSRFHRKAYITEWRRPAWPVSLVWIWSGRRKEQSPWVLWYLWISSLNYWSISTWIYSTPGQCLVRSYLNDVPTKENGVQLPEGKVSVPQLVGPLYSGQENLWYSSSFYSFPNTKDVGRRTLPHIFSSHGAEYVRERSRTSRSEWVPVLHLSSWQKNGMLKKIMTQHASLSFPQEPGDLTVWRYLLQRTELLDHSWMYSFLRFLNFFYLDTSVLEISRSS